MTSTGSYYLTMKTHVFDVLLLLPLVLFNEIIATALCLHSPVLTVHPETLNHKGFSFNKLVVNRSVPVHVEYNVSSVNLEIKSISWSLNGEMITVDDSEKSEVYYATTTTPDSSLKVTLHIRTPSARVSGTWSMTLTTVDLQVHTANCTISAPPLFRARMGAVRANEGETVTLTCDSESYPPPTEITWQRFMQTQNVPTLEAVQNVTFNSVDGVKNAVIEWHDASDHSGFYLCTSNALNGYADSLLIEVRIKSKLTYLWPCIGIIIEVVVLVITIALYERVQAKRRKAEMALSSFEGAVNT